MHGKADPNFKVENKTPIDWAAMLNKVETIKIL
jgi:hypothetical protein